MHHNFVAALFLLKSVEGFSDAKNMIFWPSIRQTKFGVVGVLEHRS